jgi:PhzF family phenazine biosynthesis protein
MDFPADPPATAQPPEGLLASLGLTTDPIDVAAGRYDWLVALPDAAAVAQARPNFNDLAAFDCRGVILTARGPRAQTGERCDEQAVDFVTRFFAPRLRVSEDPVTGSVHCALGPYWQARLGQSDFEAEQLSKRGGRLGVVVQGDRVELTGDAVTVMQGELLD